MSAFMNTLKAKEKLNQQAPVPAVAAAPVAAESAEAPAATEPENHEEAAAEIVAEAPQEISEELKKKLGGAGAFMEKLKAKSAQALAAVEVAESAEEAAAEEEVIEEAATEQAAEAPAPVTFKLDDQEFESPEQVNEYIAKVKSENAELLAEVEEIRGFVEKVSDPEFVEILRFIGEGYSWRVAMVKAGFDESLFKVDASDQDGEALVRAKIEREQAIKDMEKEQKVLQKNMETSNANLSEFATAKGMDEAKKKTFVDQMAKVHRELTNGLVTKETLEIFAKGLNYESAVQKAAEAAALKAKNEKIVTEQQKKNAAALPQLGRGIPAERKQLKELVKTPSGNFMEKLKARQAAKQ